ncbi:DUF7317 family protein [Haloplanus salilacus]|uniref:DUF7317 family protein n=1 Tax=Haloplanus salilacus TaxID=2949994 RepID=UPI003CCD45C2
MTLYRSGTLSLSQAARHAGCSEAAMAAALGADGAPTPSKSARDGIDAPAAGGRPGPAGAD